MFLVRFRVPLIVVDAVEDAGISLAPRAQLSVEFSRPNSGVESQRRSAGLQSRLHREDQPAFSVLASW